MLMAMKLDEVSELEVTVVKDADDEVEAEEAKGKVGNGLNGGCGG